MLNPDYIKSSYYSAMRKQKRSTQQGWITNVLCQRVKKKLNSKVTYSMIQCIWHYEKAKL